MSIDKTPTQKLTTSSIDGLVVTDSLGRCFVLRKPDILEQYDFIKAMGDDANHPNLVNVMLPILFIAKMDNEIFETPRLYSECRAALKRVKEEGVAAIREAIEKLGSNNQAEEKNEIKK